MGPVVKLGPGVARAQSGHGDAAAGQFFAQGNRKRKHECFGGVVDVGEGTGLKRRRGSHIERTATPALDHAWKEQPGQVR